jgi:hypothetical protein
MKAKKKTAEAGFFTHVSSKVKNSIIGLKSAYIHKNRRMPFIL